MNRRLIAIGIVVISAAASAPAVVEACGDKYMLAGRGLLFADTYRAKYPGSVLIYAASGKASKDDAKLQAMLTKAGHRVTVVSERHLLAATVAAVKADVVVTPLGDARMIDPQAKAAPSRPSVLPVLATGNKAEKQACRQQAYPCELKAKDSPENFIVAVNNTMNDRTKARTKNLPAR